VATSRVTVIDDDDDIGELFGEVFEAIGEFDVTVHVNAMPGIDELAASKPALIVVDLDLDPKREELSGAQVIHSIRSHAALRDVPVIVTAINTPRIEEVWPGFMERGDVHRLYKPFDLTSFQRVVETALGTVHGTTAGSGPAPRQLHERKEKSG
jgi:DNA-binding NtrC family response regulator